MILAAPLVIPFAEIIGVSIAALGMAKATDKVQEFIEENPEKSIKIFQMIMPAQSLANILKNESSEDIEYDDFGEEIKVESEPRSTKEIVLEEVRRGRGGRGNFSSPDAEGPAVSITGNVKRGLRDAGKIRQDNDPNYNPDKKYKGFKRFLKKADGGMIEYANGGGVGSMMQPKKKSYKDESLTKAQQAKVKPANQGGGPNYLGKEKEVTTPKRWLSSPDHVVAELAYITPREQKILLDANIYGSLKGKPNKGPNGIMSLQGDLGGYDASPGGPDSESGDGGSGNNDKARAAEIMRGNITTGQTSAVSNRTRRGAVPEFVDTVDKQGNVTGTNYVGSAYKSYGQPGFFGNLFGGSNPGYRSTYGTGSGIFGNFGGRFNKDANNITLNPETGRYESTNQNVGEVKPGMSGRILGGLLSLATGIPVAGSLIGNAIDKFKPKPKDMSQFNELGLFGQVPEDFDQIERYGPVDKTPMDNLNLSRFGLKTSPPNTPSAKDFIDLSQSIDANSFEPKSRLDFLNETFGAEPAKTFNTMEELIGIGAAKEGMFGNKLTSEGKNLGKFMNSSKNLANKNSSVSSNLDSIQNWMGADVRQNTYKDYMDPENPTQFNSTIKNAIDKGVFNNTTDFTDQVDILELANGGLASMFTGRR